MRGQGNRELTHWIPSLPWNETRTPYPVHLVSFTVFMRREVLANREAGSVAFDSGNLTQEFSEPTANPKDLELKNTWNP